MPRKMKNKAVASTAEPPSKRARFLSDDEDSDQEGNNGVALPDETLNINADYAKRFEHNKKREEKQRLEEKYKDDDSEDESTSEEEDDAADLATADLDAEIFATLDAIKKKDPRVYDKNVTFYTPFNPEDVAADDGPKKEKPMYLADYQRKQLLEGNFDADNEDAPPRTYAQEQADLKSSLVNQMHAADNDDEEDDDDNDGFLVKKDKGVHADMPAAQTHKSRSKNIDFDVDGAGKDPETYLSNFMAARAWIPTDVTRFQAMDSDDSEEENRADQFESAYNWRFEDPKASNEKLMTYGRDVAKFSVRRDDVSGRKKQREQERAKKDAAKAERQEGKARLRKLKIEEVEEKVKKIKEAAGLHGEALDLDAWSKVLEEDWDDDRWEQEMQTRFGDNYYAENDVPVSESEDDFAQVKHSKKAKKPKWDDDIDIKDLVPEFKEEDEKVAKPTFALSDDDDDEEDVTEDAAKDVVAEEEANDEDAMDIDDGIVTGKRKTKKDRLKDQQDKKRAARKERMAIEELVDRDLTADLPASAKTSGFRYRETSPDAFGLTARDILFADDTQLNQFAGLKKMAAFRDEDKKKRDKKKLGKKARLRQWRKDTFGNEDGFTGGFKDFLSDKNPAEAGAQAPEGGSRKRRGKKRKAVETES